jgi:hypothetical protein
MAMAEETSVATAKATPKQQHGNSDSYCAGSSNSSNGSANISQGGGRCGGRRFHVDTIIGFLQFLLAKKR